MSRGPRDRASGSVWHIHRRRYWVIFAFTAILGIAVLFLANARFGDDFQREQRDTQLQPKSRSVIVRITIDTGKAVRAFEGEPDGMAIGEALGQIADLAGFSLTFREGRILEFAGRQSGARGSWRLYRNGSEIDRPERVILAGGDRILLRYQ